MIDTLCITVVASKQIPSALNAGVLRGVKQNHNIQPYMASPVLRRTGGPSSRPGVTSLFICVCAIPEMQRRSGNVQYNCANKQRSCHPCLSSSSLCLPARLLHSPLSSPAASGQRYHYTTRQTVTLVHL